MNRIEAQFVSYQMKVIPEGASESQLKETQRAFYAGAAAALSILLSMSLQTTAEEAQSILSEVDRELRQFAESVTKGRN